VVRSDGDPHLAATIATDQAAPVAGRDRNGDTGPVTSEANLELVRRGFEALGEGGVEGLLPFIHPEFETTTPSGLAAEPDTYRGPEGIRRYFDSFYEAMDEVSFEPEELLPVGHLVVVRLTLRARGRTTGIETAQSLAQVWELRGDRAIRVESFATLEEAIAAAEARSRRGGASRASGPDPGQKKG
jgi:ketosteroid isomerase-like protein